MDYYGLLFLYYLKGLSGKSVLKLFFNIEAGGTEQLLPENTSAPTTTPILADIQYPDGLRTDQYFTYRETPTTVSNKARIKTIKGQTLKWNQLASVVGEQTGTVGLFGANTYVYSDHKYLMTVEATPSGSNTMYMSVYYNDGGNRQYNQVTGTSSGKYAMFFNCNYTASGGTANVLNHFWFYAYNVSSWKNLMLFDLTAMGLDSLTDEEILQWFADYYPLPYYDYNAGTLLSFNGTGIKTVGKNKFYYPYVATSQTVSGVECTINTDGRIILNGTATSSFYINIFPNYPQNRVKQLKGTYTLGIGQTVPANLEVNFGVVINGVETSYGGKINRNNIKLTKEIPSNWEMFCNIRVLQGASLDHFVVEPMLNFGNEALTFEPYISHTTNLPIATYFPTGMKSAGTVYDELTPSKATTRIGAVTFNGSENWAYDSNNALYQCAVSGAVITNATTQYNVYTKNNRFDDKSWTTRSEGSLGMYFGASFIFIKSTQFADVNALKTWLQSNPVTVYYELATPTETPITTEDANEALSLLMGKSVSSSNANQLINIITKGE